MSRKERSRLEILSRVKDGQLTVARAAEVLGLSRRQAYRLRDRYEAEGDAGLAHRLRGRAGNRGSDAEVRRAVVELCRTRYAGFGPTLACEHLAEDGYAVGRETLRRWLLAEGLWSERRRRPRHRARRERKACLGEMVQMDGSEHDWFEGRGPRCVLMVVIDDATGRTLARFFPSETTSAAFEVFGAYCRRHGVPRALYVDRDSIYRSDRQATVEEELRGESPLTQFGRAMGLLGVELILANSPQAKGRVERMNGTLQDRLVKEMRLAGVSGIEAGNAFLDGTFLPRLNRRFAVPAREPSDLHVPLASALAAVGEGTRLDEVLCWEEPRVVQNDWCVQWRNRVFQLERRHEALGLAGRKVTVREKLDGTVQLLSNGHKLHWRELPGRPRRAEPPAPVVKNNKPWTPPPSHPWKAAPACGPRSGSAAGAASPARGPQAGKTSRRQR